MEQKVEKTRKFHFIILSLSVLDSMTSEMSGASSLPNTPLPSTLNPFFDNISAMSTQDDDINVWSSQNSPGSQRGPTYKDMAEKMKQLTQENFQLKIRVFVCEQASGVKHSASNFAGNKTSLILLFGLDLQFTQF